MVTELDIVREEAGHSAADTDEVLARLTSGSRPISPAELDALATLIANQTLRGERSLPATHAWLAVMVDRSTVPYEVAKAGFTCSKPAYGEQTVVDLGLRLRDIMMNKILGTPDKPSGVRLEMLAQGHSFTGWVRNFLRACWRSELRNLGVVYRQQPTDFDTLHTVHGAVAVEDELEQSGFEQVVSRFMSLAAGSRPLARLHLASAALRQAYRLPATATIPAEQRPKVQAALGANPRAALEVVGSLIVGVGHGDPLAAIFDDWTPDDLATLAGKRPEVAQMIAWAASSPIPPVHRSVGQRLRQRVVEGLDARSALAARVDAMVQAWLVSASTIEGNEYSSQTWVPKSDEQVADEAAEFVRQATLALRLGFTGPSSPEQIAAWLSALAEEITLDLADPAQGRCDFADC